MTPAEIRALLAKELRIAGHVADVVDHVPSTAQPASTPAGDADYLAALRASFPSTRALCQWVERQFRVKLDISRDADTLYREALDVARAATPAAPATVDAPTPAAAAPALDERSASISRLIERSFREDDRRPTRAESLQRLLGGGG